MQIVSDKSEGDGKVKAKEVWRRAEWDEFQAMEAAVVAASRVRKTAEAAEAASEEAVARSQSARISRARVSWVYPSGLVTPGVAMTKQTKAPFNEALVVKAPAHTHGFVARAIDLHVQFYGEISEKTKGLLRSVARFKVECYTDKLEAKLETKRAEAAAMSKRRRTARSANEV